MKPRAKVRRWTLADHPIHGRVAIWQQAINRTLQLIADQT